MKRRAHALAVPTNDLGRLGEPITLFGEKEMDRLLKAQSTYPFYTEGSKELLEARIHIAEFSIMRLKRTRDDPDEDLDNRG
ncbi:hypothetical protein IFM89_005430 [Coptis chinensis]|uniref:Pre-mRNA processing factor 4 (PRP4)-like domain-containing protein n=1 Tax=Coptis chinensis TaxID=261450 RepID=A0A835M933_9MAGN|nr:hypothetical protein IFM89_005430 [Coptis chinensis]